MQAKLDRFSESVDLFSVGVQLGREFSIQFLAFFLVDFTLATTIFFTAEGNAVFANYSEAAVRDCVGVLQMPDDLLTATREEMREMTCAVNNLGFECSQEFRDRTGKKLLYMQTKGENSPKMRSRILWVIGAKNPVDNPQKRSYFLKESAEDLRSVSSASTRSKNSPCELYASLGVATSQSSVLSHHSCVYSTSTYPGHNRQYGGGIPRSPAVMVEGFEYVQNQVSQKYLSNELLDKFN